MAPKKRARGPTLDRLPDRILADVGLDGGARPHQRWSDYLQQLARHIGPTRS
jgi:hypothetical protein